VEKFNLQQNFEVNKRVPKRIFDWGLAVREAGTVFGGEVHTLHRMHYPLCYAKSIKFLSSSSVVQILRQLKLISMNIAVLIERKNDLDLMMKETSDKKY
jgi:hypothetical protein